MTGRSQQLKIITGSGIFVVLAITALIALHFRAGASNLSSQPKASPVVLAPSRLLVTIQEEGKAALGLLLVGGNCNDKTLPSQTGNFSCTLSTTNDAKTGYTLQSLIFQSFTSNTLYSLPIQVGNVEPTSLLVQPGKDIVLRAVISNGQVQVSEFDGRAFSPVDPAQGLEKQLLE